MSPPGSFGSMSIAGLVLCLASTRQLLEFRPAEGSVAVKAIETEFELERAVLELESQWSDGPLVLGGGARLVLAQSVVFRDEYTGIDEGQVETLHRCLERLEIRAESEFPSRVDEERSALEGACVVFAREGLSGEFEVVYAEADRHRDEELIRGLEADMDFTALLPGREVARGDSWTTPGSVIADLVFPGGRLPFALEHDDPRNLLGDLREFTGDLAVEFHGISICGDDEIAELHVRGELEGETRWTEEIEEYPLPFFGSRPALVDRNAETSCTIRGELLWNLDLGRFDSALFEGDLDVSSEEVAEFEDGFEMHTSSEWKGSFSLRALAEGPEE